MILNFPFPGLPGKGIPGVYMKIKMLKTRQGSPDGISVHTYCAEDIVEIPDELAKVFIRKRWAKNMESKNLGKAPENKRARTRKKMAK